MQPQNTLLLLSRKIAKDYLSKINNFWGNFFPHFSWKCVDETDEQFSSEMITKGWKDMLSMEREETRGSSSRGMCNFKRLSRSINLAFEAFPRLFLASITVILPLLAAAATRVVVVVYYHVSTFWLSPKKGLSSLWLSKQQLL